MFYGLLLFSISRFIKVIVVRFFLMALVSLVSPRSRSLYHYNYLLFSASCWMFFFRAFLGWKFLFSCHLEVICVTSFWFSPSSDLHIAWIASIVVSALLAYIVRIAVSLLSGIWDWLFLICLIQNELEWLHNWSEYATSTHKIMNL